MNPPVQVTTPCAVCAAAARQKNSPFFAGRGLDWPLTHVAGHQVHRACASDAESMVRHAQDGTLAIGGDGVGRWTTNGQAIPADCAALLTGLGLAPGLDLAATETARDAETRAAIQRYRDNQPAEPSAEERYEMLAAFGPGVTVVDVITGRRVQL
jgi:hypothetical protein